MLALRVAVTGSECSNRCIIKTIVIDADAK